MRYFIETYNFGDAMFEDAAPNAASPICDDMIYVNGVTFMQISGRLSSVSPRRFSGGAGAIRSPV